MEKEERLELEKMWRDTEKMKLKLEQARLSIRLGKLIPLLALYHVVLTLLITCVIAAV